MRRLPLPDDATADPALAAEYAAAREREGAVMAILRSLGPRAEVVRAFLALADAALYGPAALGRREREVLALATSEANGAGYSVELHAALRGGGPPGPRDDGADRLRAARDARARASPRTRRRRCART